MAPLAQAAGNYPRWKELFHNADENELDLLQRLMEFDPSKRITAQEGVKHPYCVQFHDAAHEPVAAEKVSIMIDDNEKKSTSVYREKLYSEVMPRFKENAKRKDGKAR